MNFQAQISTKQKHKSLLTMLDKAVLPMPAYDVQLRNSATQLQWIAAKPYVID
jgi:hypothetical protein